MGAVRTVIWIMVVAAGIFIFSKTTEAGHHAYKQGELLVRYKTNSHPVERNGSLKALGAHRSGRFRRTSHLQHIILEKETTVEQALAVLTSDPEVEFAEPNYYVHTQTMPNDTDFNQQWGLYNTGQTINDATGLSGMDIDAPLAWDITTGSQNIVIALIDTGCDLNHPDIQANIWNNTGEIPDNGVDDDGNGWIDDDHGWDFVDMDNNPQDASGHGSHVAGIIAGIGNNHQGIAGVAWQAQIMPLRFMDAFGEGTMSDAIAAIEYALAKGAKIINCSWGSASYSTALRQVMANADALFICAAGNSADDMELEPFYPAAFIEDNIISVAAGDQTGVLAWFSNYGHSNVHITAPGTQIYSLDIGRQTLWAEPFEATLPDDWLTGGSADAWCVTDPPDSTNALALAVTSETNYPNNADNWVQLPPQDLSSANAVQLTFRLIGQTEDFADYLYLETSDDGLSWSSCTLEIGTDLSYSGISGKKSSWTTVRADLGAWDGASALYLRLRFKSNGSKTYAGYFIDDMELSAAGPQDIYQFMQGTSMAAAYVSGLAALIESEKGLCSSQVLKSIIENSVDLDRNLKDLTSTGGRVNAYNALTYLQSLTLSANSSSVDTIGISWSAVKPLSSKVTIQRRSQNQSDFQTIDWVEADTTTFLDVDLAASVTYYYRIQAQTQDGQSGYSNQVMATTLSASHLSSSNPTSGGGSSGCFIRSMPSLL